MRACDALQLDIHYRDDVVAIGTCGCVVLFAWRGETTLERILVGDAIIRRRAEACSRAIALLSVIEEGSEPPRGEAARCVRSTLEELHDRVVGAAMVFEGRSGWFAKALDTVAGLGAAMREQVVQKHTVARDEACLWVHRRCAAAGEPETPSRAQLLDALSTLQRAIVEP